MKISAIVFTLALLSVAITTDTRMLNKKAPVAKSPAAAKKSAGPAPAHVKIAPKATLKPKAAVAKPVKAVKKPATATKAKATKKSIKTTVKKQLKKQPISKKSAKTVEHGVKKNKKDNKKVEHKGIKPNPKKAIKTSIKTQQKRQVKRVVRAKSVEHTTKNSVHKKDQHKEHKGLKPHPKKNLKLALKGVSKDGKVSKNLDYSKLVVDSLHKYHSLKKAIKSKDTKKVKVLAKWIKKRTHMSEKGFLRNFKKGSKKIKMEVLTNGAAQTKSGETPKELQAKLDKDSYSSELHKFKIGQAKGQSIPKKIQKNFNKNQRR